MRKNNEKLWKETCERCKNWRRKKTKCKKRFVKDIKIFLKKIFLGQYCRERFIKSFWRSYYITHKKTARFINKAPGFHDSMIIKKIHRIFLLGIARIIYFSLLCLIRKFLWIFYNFPRTITFLLVVSNSDFVLFEHTKFGMQQHSKT